MSSTGVEAGEEHIGESGATLTDAERELLKEELKKTEEEINTLRQVLASRQKHAQLLKHKLGITPFAELSQELQQQLKTVKDTNAYQKTSEVVAGTAETVSNKFADMRNSSLFKSFESKLGSAFTNAKMAASTSFDHLAGVARPQSQTGSPRKESPTSPLS
ncbi:unnamed protein product [Bursaphelenchus okinawaensis]|uniref:Tumor protein D52 n=1 Tax=Bursaphelenchus okinawaensis TaxID=465554 RepID=A0A811LMY7_9BILA|nr:unnamed protein product [Bursaphelenchus okinawaensis]CAG9126707.1 unnamed protein product [Bursaphelenchus okinawaensis]